MPLDFIIAKSKENAEKDYQVSLSINLDEHEDLMDFAERYEMKHLLKLGNYWGVDSCQEISNSTMIDFVIELKSVPDNETVKKIRSVVSQAIKENSNIYTFGD